MIFEFKKLLSGKVNLFVDGVYEGKFSSPEMARDYVIKTYGGIDP